MNGNEIVAKLKAGRAVPVPVHGKHDLGPGLIAAIARQTGIKLK